MDMATKKEVVKGGEYWNWDAIKGIFMRYLQE